MFFQNCKTEDECKAAYRHLFLQHGKDAEVMTEINNALKDALHLINNPTETAAKEPAQPDEKIQAAANFAAQIPGITAEINGQWVWISGVKREDKEKQNKLHNYGFKYAPKKQLWYFHTMRGFRTRKTLPIEQIRMKYGNETTQQKAF